MFHLPKWKNQSETAEKQKLPLSSHSPSQERGLFMSPSNQFPGKVDTYFDVPGTSSHNLTFLVYTHELRASQVTQWSRIRLPMQETRVRFPSWADPLEEEITTHSNILAWKNPVNRGAWWATAHRAAASDTD